MGIFNAIKNAMSGTIRTLGKDYSGNKDFLEAVSAGVAMVAAADGNISDEEIAAAVDAVAQNPTLKKFYSTNEVEQTINAMCQKAKSASGRVQLLREIDDVIRKAGNETMKEDIYLIAYDVAMASGDIDSKEQAVLDKIANRLGVDGKRLVA